jgi:hypothetical protein
MMAEDEYPNNETDEELVEIPINGTLDLHTFAPRDVKDLVPVYLDECLERGITEVRIILLWIDILLSYLTNMAVHGEILL